MYNYSCDRGMGGCKSENYGLLKEFYIPDYILEPKLAAEGVLHMPDCPVLVFINSRSGGQLGGDLLTSYRILLNKLQVLIFTFQRALCYFWISAQQESTWNINDKMETEVYMICFSIIL